MNSFDAVVYVGLVVAVVTGFNAGLLRSAVTILAYLTAMPIAVWATSLVSPAVDGKAGSPLTQNSLLLFGIFLIAGMVLGKFARVVVDETIGSGAAIPHRGQKGFASLPPDVAATVDRLKKERRL